MPAEVGRLGFGAWGEGEHDGVTRGGLRRQHRDPGTEPRAQRLRGLDYRLAPQRRRPSQLALDGLPRVIAGPVEPQDAGLASRWIGDEVGRVLRDAQKA
jgi:hypothetical protein